MSWGPAKRFWDAAQVSDAAQGYKILLDTRPLRTPAKTELIVPNRRLAEEIAAEWDRVEGEIKPQTMRFTRAANAAIDKVLPQKADVAAMLAAYGGTDLLCYRATEPAELIARQMEAWDPLLAWAETVLDAKLVATQGIVPVDQDPVVLAGLHQRVADLDVFELTAFHDLVTIGGSLVLAFAVIHERITAEFAWNTSRIDETYQEEQWGEDEDATALAQTKRADFIAAAELFFLLREA